MRLFRTTQSVQADGLIYEIVDSRAAKPDCLEPPIPRGSTELIARHGNKWLHGTFRKDGTPIGGVTREYDSPDVPCCIYARWEKKTCAHMSASTKQ